MCPTTTNLPPIPPPQIPRSSVAAPRPDRPPRPWGELPRAQEPAAAGLVIVDKDPGVTSHDIVGAMRRLAGTRKVGHAGTLDPMATGVLCIGIGKATKLLQYVTGTDKEYRATIRLGVETHTEDAQGEVVAVRGLGSLREAAHLGGTAVEDGAARREYREDCEREDVGRLIPMIDAAIDGLRGDIQQVPSSVSALKVDGQRAYARIRAGEAVELAARPVRIERFERLGEPRLAVHSENPVLDIDVVVQCSAGTYIRALARDLGDALGTGAHLTALRRIRVGIWGESEARTISQLAHEIAEGRALPTVDITSLCRGLFTCVDVSAAEADALAHGQFITGRATITTPAAAICYGRAVALVSNRGSKMKPDLLLVHAN